LYSDIDSRQAFRYTHLCIEFIGRKASPFMEMKMKASSVSFPAAVVMVVAGMIWGIVMAVTQDHSAMPAHAHLNLLGWVSLFLFGVFYHLHPAIDRSRTAIVQVALWIIGTVILTIGVGLVHTGHPGGDPLAAIGSLIVFAAMLLFGWLVVRRQRTAPAARMAAVPAE
jgi:peptidoglycan/LPS O-acetylase OafA/YrhL